MSNYRNRPNYTRTSFVPMAMDKRITIRVAGLEEPEESAVEILVEVVASITLTVLIFGLLVLAMV